MFLKNIKLNMQILKKIKVKQQVGFKPIGIWTSGLFERNQNSWTDWAFSEDMLEWIDPNECTYYAIKIIDNSKLVLKINTIKKIQRFYKKYSVKKDTYFIIDWNKVQEDGYYGIDFSKYFDDFKNDFKNNEEYIWYISLDCASQCIWDRRAFEDIQKINTNVL